MLSSLKNFKDFMPDRCKPATMTALNISSYAALKDILMRENIRVVIKLKDTKVRSLHPY